MSTARHHGVAERFTQLLRGLGLSREEFLERIDHAVTDSTFFSIANGNRQPSRALAVLIERTWGFRARYLLLGEGEPWVEAQPETDTGLSDGEQEVIRFMRKSVANAEEIRRSKDQREIWSRLAERNQRATSLLRRVAESGQGADRDLYPLLCHLTFTESHRMAQHFKRYVDLYHERRIHRLNTLFVSHFLDELPRTHFAARDKKTLTRVMKPLLAERRKQLDRIDAAIAQTRETLLGTCARELPSEYLVRNADLAQPATSIEPTLREMVREIDAGMHGNRAAPLGERLHMLLDQVADGDGTGERDFWHLMRRVTRHILAQLDPPAESPPAANADELEAHYRASIRALLN